MVTVVTSTPLIDTAAYAKAKFASKTIITDPARTACRRLGFQTLYDIPQPYQMQVRAELINAHFHEVKKGPGDVVIAFSVFEWLADWMRWAWNKTPSLAWEAVLKEAGEIVKHYDAVYHLESGELRPYDGYVWRDKPNAEQIDRLMRSLYNDFGVASKVQFIKG